MKEIPISKSYVALVDDIDYEMVSRHNWQAAVLFNIDKTIRTVYAKTSIRDESDVRRTVFIHRLVMGCTVGDGLLVDHIDSNGLNNVRSNLRIATPIQNTRNKRSHKDSNSRFLGVHFDNNRGKWRSDIKYNGKHKFIGHFLSEIDAALAYDIFAADLFGEFANLNFKIPPMPIPLFSLEI